MFLAFFVSLEMSLFSIIFVHKRFLFVWIEYVVYFFLPDGVFLACGHGRDFLHQLM